MKTESYTLVSLDMRRIPLWWRLLGLAKLPYDLARFLLVGRADVLYTPGWVLKERLDAEK